MARKRIAPSHLVGRVGHLRVADLEIDALSPRIRQGTCTFRLTPDEHIVLYLLAANAGAVVGHQELADALGRSALALRNNTVARHLSTLRKKLGDDSHDPRYIETVPGVGYRFVGGRQK